MSLTDASLGSSSLVAAVSWVENVLVGSLATSVAIIAVAGVGLGMLTGRVNLRHGLTVVLGCFILFGASAIVSGLRYAASGIGGDDVPPPMVTVPPPPAVSPRPTPVRSPAPYDPYAGASVPIR